MNFEKFYFKALNLALGGLLSLTFATVSTAESTAVSFAKDVQPIFKAYCVSCHQPDGQGFMASGLNLSTYDGVMTGTQHGPIVAPGDPLSSNLMAVLEGRTDPSIQMPHSERRAMTKDDRQILRKWIVEGATQKDYEAGPNEVIADLCLDCHKPGGSGFEASGLDMSSYHRLMKGTHHGPVVVPGDAFMSNLMVLIEGRATGGLKMPHDDQGKPSSKQRSILRRWILDGALKN